jgi:hypothetical protein
MLKPSPIEPVPEATARVARAAFRKGNPLLMDLPPGSGGVGSERHAATGVTIASMLTLASIGVR